MIRLRQLPDEALVEITLPQNLGPIFGAAFTWSNDTGRTWNPCAIYYGTDPDSITHRVPAEVWNQAVNAGKLTVIGDQSIFFWNLYLNNLHAFSGVVRVRYELLTDEGVKAEEAELSLTPSRAAYFTDWPAAVPEGSPWKIESDGLTLEGVKTEVAPVRITPGLSGEYEVFFGIPHAALFAWLKMSDESNRYPFMASKFHMEFYKKVKREIAWKTVSLTPDSVLEICTIPHARRNPDLYPFGKISYVKFVPVARKTSTRRSDWSDKKLALYFEPYSWAFLYNLDQPWQVKEAMSLYREMGDGQIEIHNQLIRFGMKALHHSRVAERFEGKTEGDDRTLSEGPDKMVRTIDILRETIAACRELGMSHYANAGLTICYQGTELEEKISREHREWTIHNVLRYDLTETRAYAAAIVREFAESGTDGVSIDCMRYPWCQTESGLLQLFRQIREAMPKTMPLSVRIPAGDTLYFKVFLQLAKEGALQCVVPSDDSQDVRTPLKPYLTFKDYGCKVYGRIDGWKTGLWWDKLTGHNSLLINPRDIRDDITRFFNEGADGIFIYQTDQHLADPFLRTAFHWQQW